MELWLDAAGIVLWSENKPVPVKSFPLRCRVLFKLELEELVGTGQVRL
jgi:hypothetical protein